MAIEQRIEELFGSLHEVLEEIWYSKPVQNLRVSNGFVCSLFLLIGLMATIFTTTYIDGVGFIYSNRLLGHDLSGVGFGVILTVFTELSMRLGSHTIRYSLNDFPGVLGFLLGNLLLSLLSLPTIIIAPELYTLLLVEIMVSMMLLIIRILIWTMPRIRQGAVS